MVYTNKMKFNKKYGQKLQTANGKDDISKLTGISMKILDEVYYRGMGAFKNNRGAVRPSVKSPQQWAMARIYSLENIAKSLLGKIQDLKYELL